MACYPDAEFEDDYHHESSQVLTLSEGGFDDSLFINPPSPSQGFHCPVCLLVLKDPHLLSCCGKHLCRVCVSRVKGSGQDCPCCRKPDFNTMLNKEKRGRVLELKIHCSNSKRGCDWTGELGDEPRHLENRNERNKRETEKDSPMHFYDYSFYEDDAQLPCLIVNEAIQPVNAFDLILNWESNSANMCRKKPVLCRNLQHSWCSYVEEVCQYGCGKGFLRCVLQVHQRDECVNRPIEVKLESFTRLTTERLRAQEMEISELKLKLVEQERRLEAERHEYLLEKDKMSQQMEELGRQMEWLKAENVEKTIQFKRGVWRFLHSPSMEKKLSDLLAKMKRNGITVVSSSKSSEQSPLLLVKGKRKGVQELEAELLELQSLVKKKQITIVRPGPIQYFVKDPNGQVVLKGVENEAQVCIELEGKEGSGVTGDCEVHSSCKIIEVGQLMMLGHDSGVTLCIYGETNQSVKRAEKRLLAIIETHFVTEEINDPKIASFSESGKMELLEFAKRLQVDIEIDCDLCVYSVKLHGCQKDVLKVKDKVRELLQRGRGVRWLRCLPGGEEEEYGDVFNDEIEHAYQQNKRGFYKSTDQAERFTINFSTMEETDLDTGEVCRVCRVDMEVTKPSHWDPMPKGTTCYSVSLHPRCREFDDVVKKFNSTMKTKYKHMVSVERIQNSELYEKYALKKTEMERRNPPGCQNEQWLFYRPLPNEIKSLNVYGFRRYTESNKGVIYGKGMYFARDASYKGATPDGNGICYIYLARVLTGEYTTGNNLMVVPPPKNPWLSKRVLFDSTVDNTASPSIFVVYSDSQSYPAYLIKYN